MIEITRTWQAPAVDAELAYRREHLLDELGQARRAAYLSRAARAERAARRDAAGRQRSGGRGSVKRWLRGWSLRGSGAWHAAR